MRLVAALFAVAVQFSMAGQETVTPRDLADIRRRLDDQSRQIAELEAQNRALRETVERLQTAAPMIVSNAVAAAQTSASAPPPASSDKAAALLAPLTDRGVRIKPYGYIKLDMIHNSSKTDGDDYSFYVRPPWESGGGSSESTIGMRESRLGMDMVAPETENGINVTGKFEIDFYSGTVASPNMRIRHAYLNLDMGDGWSVLAGQTYDAWWVAYPMILDGGWAGGTGHPYNRRPQLRLTKTHTFDDGTRLTARIAAVQNAGTDLDKNLVDDGPASNWPMIQGALILEKKLLTEKASTLSLSGSYGREKIEAAPNPSADGTYDTELLMANAILPIWRKFSLTGSLYAGQNMDTYKAGICQGVNMTRGIPIDSRGGWLQGTVDLTSKWQFNLGYAFEDTDDADLEYRDRSFNSRYYINAFYTLTPHVKVAGEYGYLLTDFLDDGSASDNQLHFAMYYFF